MDRQQLMVRDKLAQIIGETFGHEYSSARKVAGQIMDRFDLTDKRT